MTHKEFLATLKRGTRVTTCGCDVYALARKRGNSVLVLSNGARLTLEAREVYRPIGGWDGPDTLRDALIVERHHAAAKVLRITKEIDAEPTPTVERRNCRPVPK